MDKLAEPISFKVPPRVKVLIQDKALEEGIDVSESYPEMGFSGSSCLKFSHEGLFESRRLR